MYFKVNALKDSPHLPQVGHSGDLQRLFDKLPTPGDNLVLQNAPTQGTSYADKSPPIARPGVGGD